MKKTNKSLRFTEQDTGYITWIAEQQASRLDTLQFLIEIRGKKIDPRALRCFVEQRQRLGLAQKKILLAKSPSIIWPTLEGMRVANLSVCRRNRTYWASFQQWIRLWLPREFGLHLREMAGSGLVKEISTMS